MKSTLIYLFLLLISFSAYCENLGGAWQGVMFTAGQKPEQGTLLYIYIDGNEGEVNGLMRDEKFETDLFAVKQTKFTINASTISFKQVVVSKNKKAAGIKWCRMSGEMSYNSETGYLTGNFSSSDCKRVTGTIILFQGDFVLKESEEQPVSQIWFEPFLKDLKEGLSAPKIREKERKNFKFEPVYFDYDEAIIKAEYTSFLDRLIKVVKGHSDLRVKVVGHTDSDGSDAYNDELSKRRAQAIIDYFVKHGLDEDRLEFDFKGERNPISNNNTPEGKQLNRRVDFSFI